MGDGPVHRCSFQPAYVGRQRWKMCLDVGWCDKQQVKRWWPRRRLHVRRWIAESAGADVLSGVCKTASQPHGMAPELQTHQTGPHCFPELPGLIYPKAFTPNHLHDMVEAKLQFRANGKGDPNPYLRLITLWNEFSFIIEHEFLPIRKMRKA